MRVGAGEGRSEVLRLGMVGFGGGGISLVGLAVGCEIDGAGCGGVPFCDVGVLRGSCSGGLVSKNCGSLLFCGWVDAFGVAGSSSCGDPRVSTIEGAGRGGEDSSWEVPFPFEDDRSATTPFGMELLFPSGTSKWLVESASSALLGSASAIPALSFPFIAASTSFASP